MSPGLTPPVPRPYQRDRLHVQPRPLSQTRQPHPRIVFEYHFLGRQPRVEATFDGNVAQCRLCVEDRRSARTAVCSTSHQTIVSLAAEGTWKPPVFAYHPPLGLGRHEYTARHMTVKPAVASPDDSPYLIQRHGRSLTEPTSSWQASSWG